MNREQSHRVKQAAQGLKSRPRAKLAKPPASLALVLREQPLAQGSAAIQSPTPDSFCFTTERDKARCFVFLFSHSSKLLLRAAAPLTSTATSTVGFGASSFWGEIRSGLLVAASLQGKQQPPAPGSTLLPAQVPLSRGQAPASHVGWLAQSRAGAHLGRLCKHLDFGAIFSSTCQQGLFDARLPPYCL